MKDPAVGADDKEAFTKEQKADDEKMKEIEAKMALGEKEIAEDEKKAKIREIEAEEDIKKQHEQEEKVALLDKNVNDYRKKQILDKAKQDAKFGEAIAPKEAPKPIKEENDKLDAANKKIAAMFAEDERIAAEKAAKNDKKAEEVGKNEAIAA
jgi:hypothetical protein